MTQPTEWEPIKAGVIALAAQCDGARTRDGAGFNGRDTAFGQSMARKTDRWTPKMAHATWKMLRTYRGQLSGLGIDWEAFAEPKIPAGGVQPRPVNRQPRLAVTEPNATIRLTFPYDPALINAVKALPSRKANKDPEKGWSWVVPFVGENCDPLLDLLRTWEFETDESLKQGLRDLDRQTQAMESMSTAMDSEIEIPDTVALDLYPFQRAGVAYAIEAQRTIIADVMGLGKTPQAMVSMEIQNAFPCLVVVPAGLKLNWEREIAKWLPGRTATVLSGKKARAEALIGDFVVVNYDILAAWQRVLQAHPWEGFIFDEFHYLKNKKAGRTKAAGEITNSEKPILMLSGTPILNRPVELVAPLEIMGRLDDLGGFWRFTQRYCDAKQYPVTVNEYINGKIVKKEKLIWNFTGSSNERSLNQQLRANCMVRRLKEEVLGELPPLTRNEVTLSFTDEGRDQYDEAERDFLGWIWANAVDQEFLKSIENLPPEAQENAMLDERETRTEKAGAAEHFTKIGYLQRLCAQAKLPAVIDWIENFLESEEKLLVFAHHRSMTLAIAEHFKCPTIVGGTSAREKQEAEDRFQTDKRCQLLVGNTLAAGVGLNLTAAHHVAFAELSWRPGDHEQAEARCYGRLSDLHGATSWYLLGEDSIDSWIWSLLAEKKSIFEQVANGDRSHLQAMAARHGLDSQTTLTQ